MAIRVLLADDQDLVGEGIGMLLQREDGIDVVGDARNGREAVELARELQPDIVLMDVRMPELDGVAATSLITADDFAADPNRPVKVLVLTTYNVGAAVRDALRKGASGFLLKDRASTDLVAAVKVIARGEAWLDPAVTLDLIAELRAVPESTFAARDRLSQLTPRESEVLTYVARGMSNAEIAERLVLGEATVKTHVSRILMKLDLRDRAQAVAVAYQNGLVRVTGLD
ncbi:response regulator transcription factor [Lentzea tibetensis]|uniref:Response regulator transcription factor n=1 Tax=Lentzea tibetensis TaxID=2591470 RepID=A0A563EUB3_9PSEU|nr:response regulator transcription factor [Lentzea tibetensis]TWP51295.1 response regulator transcription factor [Lentzea tibetensis]